MATRMRFSRRIKDASAEEELLKSPVASPAVSPKNTAPPTPERLERRLDVDESFAAAAASAPDDQNSDEKNNSDASPVDCATTPRSPPTDDAESKRPPKEHSTPKISVYLEDDDGALSMTCSSMFHSYVLTIQSCEHVYIPQTYLRRLQGPRPQKMLLRAPHRTRLIGCPNHALITGMVNLSPHQ